MSKAETVEQFQIRRIKWATAKLATENELLKPWKIIRLAGLKQKTADHLSSYIAQEIRTMSEQNLQWRVA